MDDDSQASVLQSSRRVQTCLYWTSRLRLKHTSLLKIARVRSTSSLTSRSNGPYSTINVAGSMILAFTRRIKRLDINKNRLFTKLKIRKYITTSFELTFKPASKDRLKRSPVDVVGKLGEDVPAQVSSLSLNHGSKLRDPSVTKNPRVAEQCDVNIHSLDKR
ncbi:hypothetical protein TNCV_2169471 [Trichonephila clavipes]|nr:hypothetical protein TNCV_2169471 [Trichonephila clavipes]